MYVKTRTPTQVQSHAQKFFLRQRQCVKNKRSIHDLCIDSPEMQEFAKKLREHQADGGIGGGGSIVGGTGGVVGMGRHASTNGGASMDCGYGTGVVAPPPVPSDGELERLRNTGHEEFVGMGRHNGDDMRLTRRASAPVVGRVKAEGDVLRTGLDVPQDVGYSEGTNTYNVGTTREGWQQYEHDSSHGEGGYISGQRQAHGCDQAHVHGHVQRNFQNQSNGYTSRTPNYSRENGHGHGHVHSHEQVHGHGEGYAQALLRRRSTVGRTLGFGGGLNLGSSGTGLGGGGGNGNGGGMFGGIGGGSLAVGSEGFNGGLLGGGEVGDSDVTGVMNGIVGGGVVHGSGGGSGHGTGEMGVGSGG